MFTPFFYDLLRSMGADERLWSESGVTVLGHPDRAENHVTAGYVIGEHFVVTCDPAAEDLLRSATADMAPTMQAWQQIAAAAGGELLGTGRIQLLPDALPDVHALPEGFSFRRLDPNNPDDLQLIAEFIERSDADDLDEAEIAIDNLDDIIRVVLDDVGDIVTYSAACPFEPTPQYGDIGIMTSTEHRGKALGSIAVAALCPILRAEGLEPLYRCDEDNVGSIKVSAGLGFEIATQLAAYRFPIT